MSSTEQPTKIIGYAVVDRHHNVINSFRITHKALAEKLATESTNDCVAGGIDWDYQVANITVPMTAKEAEQWAMHKRMVENANIEDRDGADSAALYAKERRERG